MTRRPQGGFALVEVLVTVALTAFIVVPLLLWMLTGLRVRDSAQRLSRDSTASAALASFLSRDVPAASAVTPAGPDCGAGDEAGGTVVVSLVAADEAGDRRTAYVAVARADGTTDLVRRRCADPSGPADDVTTIATDVRPPGTDWSTAVSCRAPVGLGASPCQELTVTLRGRSGRPIVASAASRITGAT